jgi:hypothetical protein
VRVERYAWLPVALPVTAQRIDAHDPELAALLGDAAGDEPDVEIGRAEQLRGGAAAAIVAALAEPAVGPAVVRSGARVARHLAVRRIARRATAALRRLGYAHVRVVEWEPGHHIDPAPAVATRAERLPLGLVAVGTRDATTSVFAAAAAAASCDVAELRAMKSGAVVATTDVAVLRVAVGAPADTLLRAAAVLEELRQKAPALRSLVPEPTACGSAGLGTWTTETRLTGVTGPVDGALLEQCVDVLVQLYDSARGTAPAETAKGFDDPALSRLAARLDRELADVPCGFGHGDFWGGNLLREDGRLTGIVDWEGGGPGRLPGVDLMQLLTAPVAVQTATPEPGRGLEWLWPRLDTDVNLAAYFERIGFRADARVLRRLALAFWLERVDWVITRSGADPAWLRRNVEGVLRWLANSGELE